MRVTTASRVCSYLAERRWLQWLRVSKRSVGFGSGYSEMSGAKESKAVLSCERPEERSAFACFLPPGSGKGTPEGGDGQPE